jgi:hypothetical protein
MLRSAQRTRLEARTASLLLIFRYVNRFPDIPFRGDDTEGSHPVPSDVGAGSGTQAAAAQSAGSRGIISL